MHFNYHYEGKIHNNYPDSMYVSLSLSLSLSGLFAIIMTRYNTPCALYILSSCPVHACIWLAEFLTYYITV